MVLITTLVIATYMYKSELTEVKTYETVYEVSVIPLQTLTGKGI